MWRRNGSVALGCPRQHRLLPLILAVVEHLRARPCGTCAYMSLCSTEQVLGVAQVRAQVRRHRVERMEDPGERLREREHERIARIGQVRGDGAVVRVDHHLHAVAHVVDAVATAAARTGSGSSRCRRRGSSAAAPRRRSRCRDRCRTCRNGSAGARALPDVAEVHRAAVVRDVTRQQHLQRPEVRSRTTSRRGNDPTRTPPVPSYDV